MDVAIIGAGRYSIIISEILKLCDNYKIVGFFDDFKSRFNDTVHSIRVIDNISNLEKHISKDTCLVVGFGDNKIRKEYFNLYEDKGYNFCNVIHPKSIISKTSNIGEGTVVREGAIICDYAKIGSNCIINTGSIVEHHDVIGDHTHIAPGVHLAGSVKIGSNTLIGIGVTIIHNVTIGSNTTIVSGCVIYNDIPDNSLVKLPFVPKVISLRRGNNEK